MSQALRICKTKRKAFAMKALHFLLLLTPLSCLAQKIAIKEVLYNPTTGPDKVTLINTTIDSPVMETIDVSEWAFCKNTFYHVVGAADITVESGDLNIPAGGSVRLALPASYSLDNEASDLGLYSFMQFTNPEAMHDFVQWGDSFDSGDNPPGREDIAIAKGIWEDEQFVAPAAPGESMVFDGVNGGGGELTLVSDFDNLVVPITLLYYTALSDGNAVMLNWATASEVNNSHFIIRRTSGDADFSEIGQIPATGFSSTIKTYTFTDHPPGKGTYLYQLSQEDLDGVGSEMGIRSVRLDPDRHNMLTVIPNIASADQSVMVVAAKASEKDEELQLIGPDGREIFTFQMPANTESIQVTLPASLLPGTYYIYCKAMEELEPLVIVNSK